MSPRKIFTKSFGAVLFCCCVFPAAAFVPTDASVAHAQSLTTYRSVPHETSRDLSLARKYAKHRRYELARQHYLLALASSNTTELRDSIQRDLQVIELKIRTLR